MKKKLKSYSDAMLQKNIEDKDVYTKLDICKQTWSQIKNYETKMKADNLLKFCDLVECDPRDLLIKGYNI